MFIRGIGVEIPHSGDSYSPVPNNQPRVCFPVDFKAWEATVRQAFDDHGHIHLTVASVDFPGAVGIAIGHPDLLMESPSRSLAEGECFGFVVELSTLRQLRGAIDAAIASLEK